MRRIITRFDTLSAYHKNKYNIHMYDFRLIFCVLILGILGINVINSAADGFAAKQLLGFVMGMVGMIILSLIDYNYIAKFDWILYAINIVMLLAVRVFGITVNGAKRWFSLGSFGTLQPSELSKVIMTIFFASIINDNKDKISELPVLIRLGIIYAIPLLLIVLEPDLSTTLVFVFLFAVMMFIGELSYKIIGAVVGISVPLFAAFMWYVQTPNPMFLREYQVQRILSFLHPSEYMLTTYNQQYNSMMAIGSGLLTGKGLNNNTITSVKGGNFISEPQTDFIFAIVGEELGFIGGCAVILLLALIVLECIHIARDAKDLRGRLIASGAAAIISFQTFVNISVATGMLPNTGLPLPFVSYGLSSLLSNFMLLGLVLNVGLQRNRR